MQQCVNPRVEDTCTVEHCPNTDTAIEDVPMNSGAMESEDATKIECAFWSASINGCKDILPTFHFTDDNEDDGSSEDQVDASMSNNLSFGGVGSPGASCESNSIIVEYSGQGIEEHHAQKEGDEALDLLAHDVDPYKDAMRNNADRGFHAFLPSKP